MVSWGNVPFLFNLLNVPKHMQVPGNIYLCQVNEQVSCGACCGLYNVPDASFEGISRLLETRTAVFSEVPREMEAILAFGRSQTEQIAGRLPMPEFHHCPYIGLIGPEKRTVGCLLHPLGDGNRGIDFRGLSHYGSMTCHMYFCPTHERLPAAFKQCLRQAAVDWYHYGLLLTETDLLEAVCDQVTTRTGKILPSPESAGMNPAWADLLHLKDRWPFALKNRPLANYFFNDRLYPKPAVDYTNTGKSGSPYDAVFRELYTVFHSDSELEKAEKWLDDLFDRLAGIHHA